MATDGPGQTALPTAAAAAFAERSDDLLVVLDHVGTITWASASAEQICGEHAAQLVGRPFAELIDPDDRHRAATAMLEANRAPGAASFQGRLADGDQTTWVEVALTSLVDQPEVNGLIGRMRDVSDHRRIEQRLHFHSSMLTSVGQAITARDLDGIVMFWNPAAVALFGYTAEEMLGKRIGDVMSAAPGHQEQAMEASKAHRAARPWTGLVVMRAKDGRSVKVETTSNPVFDRDGNHLGTVTASHDLTGILAQQQRSEDDRRRLADAQASANLGSFEFDLRTGDFHGSDEFWRIIGRTPSTSGALDHVHPDDLPQFHEAFFAARDGSTNVSLTHRIVRPDGAVRWVVTRSSQFETLDDMIIAGTVLDITEQHEAQEALLHQATHDPLTGLLHSHAFVDQLATRLASGPEAPTGVVLLVIDIDHFKAVNDRLGHIDADEVFRRLGARLVDALPPNAVVARLASDEFVICIDQIHQRGDERPFIAEVHEEIRRPMEVRGALLTLDASVGVVFAEPGQEVEELLRNADLAMYEAKRQGRGRAEYFDEDLAARGRRRARLVDDLRAALGHGEVATFLQPEYDLSSGSIFGFEALARWRHAELGPIGPDEFIPLAEESGLIGDLGRQMLANAGACLARWNERWPDRTLTIAVNVSPHQLSDPAFADDVCRAIEDNGLRPGQLCIEVTESALMDEPVVAAAAAHLHGSGAPVAIDDFGTGYSSFRRLKVLAIDFLKIDQSFVAGIGRSPDDEVIISTMVTMARSLGVAVIAEGIETAAQHDYLAELGCEYGQGYLWSPAVDEATATELIESERSAPTPPT